MSNKTLLYCTLYPLDQVYPMLVHPLCPYTKRTLPHPFPSIQWTGHAILLVAMNHKSISIWDSSVSAQFVTQNVLGAPTIGIPANPEIHTSFKELNQRKRIFGINASLGKWNLRCPLIWDKGGLARCASDTVNQPRTSSLKIFMFNLSALPFVRNTNCHLTISPSTGGTLKNAQEGVIDENPNRSV